MFATEDSPPAQPAEQAGLATGREPSRAGLVLGPVLRYVSETEATVWVETDRECQVEVLGRQARTFEVAGHHYALVVIDGLEPGSEHEYQVRLDGAVHWPQPDSGFPPSVLRTLAAGRPVRIAFGSCRVTRIADRNLTRRARRRRRDAEEAARLTAHAAGEMPNDAARPRDPAGVDALAATAAVLRGTPRDQWPDVLLMLGDQAYADEPGPATRALMADRRAAAGARTPAGEAVPAREVADFDEYSALYRESWNDPEVRWLLSVLPSAMIFDDHDVHDDWNISGSWRRDFARLTWWNRRIESAYQSYWVYQHLGNLSPAELAADETWAKVTQPGDAAPVLAGLAHRADRRDPSVRWSFSRAFGRVRVVMLDSRSRRVVDGERRLMADEGEWRWLTEQVSGNWEHVVLATSVPPLLPRGIHTLESWNERVCAGAWGPAFARFGERLRRAVDLEHWPAFGASFAQLEVLLARLAAGRHSPDGRPPASVTLISGDIHHSYLAAVDLPRRAPGAAPLTEAGRVAAVNEVVCSPFHQAIPPTMKVAQQLASARPSGVLGTVAATLAGARVPRISWRITRGPWYENMIAFLDYDGPAARVRFTRSVLTPSGGPTLATAARASLTPPLPPGHPPRRSMTARSDGRGPA